MYIYIGGGGGGYGAGGYGGGGGYDQGSTPFNSSTVWSDFPSSRKPCTLHSFSLTIMTAQAAVVAMVVVVVEATAAPLPGMEGEEETLKVEVEVAHLRGTVTGRARVATPVSLEARTSATNAAPPSQAAMVVRSSPVLYFQSLHPLADGVRCVL